jgi:hypothetical protein
MDLRAHVKSCKLQAGVPEHLWAKSSLQSIDWAATVMDILLKKKKLFVYNDSTVLGRERCI